MTNYEKADIESLEGKVYMDSFYTLHYPKGKNFTPNKYFNSFRWSPELIIELTKKNFKQLSYASVKNWKFTKGKEKWKQLPCERF